MDRKKAVRKKLETLIKEKNISLPLVKKRYYKVMCVFAFNLNKILPLIRQLAEKLEHLFSEEARFNQSERQ